MRIIGDALWGFIKKSNVKKVISGIVISFVLLVAVDYYIDFLNNSLSFIVEIIAVFMGLYLGFDFTRYMDNRRFNRETRKIFRLFIDELKENKRNMISLYHAGGTDYAAYMLKTTVWDVYKIKLGDADPKNVDELTDIYFKIILINDNIKYRPKPSDHPKSSQVRLHVVETSKNIDKWILKIEEFYKKIDKVGFND